MSHSFVLFLFSLKLHFQLCQEITLVVFPGLLEQADPGGVSHGFPDRLVNDHLEEHLFFVFSMGSNRRNQIPTQEQLALQSILNLTVHESRHQSSQLVDITFGELEISDCEDGSLFGKHKNVAKHEHVHWQIRFLLVLPFLFL